MYVYCFLFFLFVFLSIFPHFSFANISLEDKGCTKKTFIVTAYYSPIPDQLFYYKGDYQAEIKLNGEGMTGASGKPVFDGMLAAPKSYPFGTKIYLSGRGWGEVADRGGAIVHSGERGWNADRLDIRMGKGEAGLIRALTFGVKQLEGWVCPHNISLKDEDNKKIPLGFKRSNIPLYKHFFTFSLFIQELWEGRNDPRVRELQRYLIRLGYLQPGMDTGFFGKQTKKAVCDFQVANKILSPTSPWCGYFGASTRIALKNILTKKSLLPDDFWETTSIKNIKNYAKSASFEQPVQLANQTKTKNLLVNQNTQKLYEVDNLQIEKKYQEDFPKKGFVFTKYYHDGAYGGDIKLLQQRLVLLGYNPGPIDGKYTQETKKAVEAFQKAHNLIDADIGYLDEQTRKVLNSIDWDFVEKNKEFVRLVMNENNDFLN